ncbi:MAG: hypothetical protein HQL29_02805 [Candidatus Omnitrophica bacterium]|nr:hypothetical protein [Candidatus Omnitrophota bacterium]
MDLKVGTLGLGLGKGYAYTAAATGFLSTALIVVGGILVVSGIVGMMKKKNAKA